MKVNEFSLLMKEDKTCFLSKKNGFLFGESRMEFSNPDKIAKLMMDAYHLHQMAEEYVYLLCMDQKHHMIGVFEISHGSVNASVCSPREIFIRALLAGAVGIILVHNHPSGDLTPSQDDIRLTKKMTDAGKLMDICLLDHIIIGSSSFVSLHSKQACLF